ncbi:hypothetical protein RR47_GL001848 [Enterococcus columbae DSM 7374 = ATCC 51263]|nr:hypothetical protein RR47_GL001848 [Enterococcus columbae DSM 7374 = ATCC 51263]
MSLIVVFIFTFKFTWAYLTDASEIKEEKISVTSMKTTGLECSFNVQNLDFSNTNSSDSKTIDMTIKNGTSLFLSNIQLAVNLQNSNKNNIENWNSLYKVEYSLDGGTTWNSDSPNISLNKESGKPDGNLSLKVRFTQISDVTANLDVNHFRFDISATSVGGASITTLIKYLSLTPRSSGIYNDLPEDLGDLGIAGYFHIFAKDRVSYSVSQENNINIVTKNAIMKADFNSKGLINYFANSLSVNTQVVSDKNSKFIFGNSVDYSNIKFTNPPIIMKDAVNSKYIDIDSEFTKLTSLSSEKINDRAKTISALSFNDKNNQQIDVTSSDNKDYVLLKLPISYLCNNLTSLNIVNSTNKVVIINVYEDTNLTEVSITPEIKYNGTSSPQSAGVLWNFSMSGVSKLIIKNSFVGTILAPNMSVDVESNGHVRGGIIAQNVEIRSSTGRIKLPAFHLS